ncbi:GLPGLI family protein [Pedobacter metabolipauper]|uniref:GLPGLI family protein n=1 Tax=Pedobacter metabolipauper TaxID=425513 RepID=A0A4R6SRF7_9SPHI|nr:GLPGLI family protein [Pedobacter metabolipauper]TDQ06960.1 GLPGLI family protein [Pedobacter metabolipauper]
MKLQYFIIGIILFLSHSSFAQEDSLITSGTIEFEKKIDSYAQMRKRLKGNPSPATLRAYNEYRDNQPQFLKVQSKLDFKDHVSLFTPLNAQGTLIIDPGQSQSIVFNDCFRKTSIVQKQFLETTFLISDSTRQIRWKMTNETRHIAGFLCRRANAVIMDSIYVVAFFTVKIQLSSGPESFAGLPGMILGLALPHENITWFATRVTARPASQISITAPSKGKPITNAGFKIVIIETLKGWGAFKPEMLLQFLL